MANAVNNDMISIYNFNTQHDVRTSSVFEKLFKSVRKFPSSNTLHVQESPTTRWFLNADNAESKLLVGPLRCQKTNST